MTDKQEQSRAEFEEWTKQYCNLYDLGYTFQTLANGDYMNTSTDIRWKQWQHLQAKLTAKEKELEELRSERHELKAILTEAADYLDINKYTNIAHNSILHTKFRVYGSYDESEGID